MIRPEDEKILVADGWVVECYSPLEISHAETNSFASGYAAETVIDSISSYVIAFNELPSNGERYVPFDGNNVAVESLLKEFDRIIADLPAVIFENECEYEWQAKEREYLWQNKIDTFRKKLMKLGENKNG